MRPFLTSRTRYICKTIRELLSAKSIDASHPNSGTPQIYSLRVPKQESAILIPLAVGILAFRYSVCIELFIADVPAPASLGSMMNPTAKYTVDQFFDIHANVKQRNRRSIGWKAIIRSIGDISTLTRLVV